MERLFFDFVKGLWIGGTLTVPGVSGGTMAMVLGVYERLIRAVNSLRKGEGRRECIRFLLVFGFGGLLGMLALSGVVSRLMSRFPNAMIFFFSGAIAGGIPAILHEMKRSVFEWHHLFYLPVGLGIVFLISMIPQGIFSSSSGILLQMLGGIIAAVALVLPGISVSHMLYVLGIYESLMTAIAEMKILTLLPFGIGSVVGVLITVGAVERLLACFKTQTYLVILGFVLGSVFEMLGSSSIQVFSLWYLFIYAAGYLPIWLLFKYNKAGA